MSAPEEPADADSVGTRVRASALSRLTAPGRLAGIDLARGLAVLGMLAAHLIAVPAFIWGDTGTWIAVVSGRSSILFALLAGVSIALTTGGRSPQTGEALQRSRVRLAERAVALWLLGLLLIGTGVPVLIILPAYGILFLLSTLLLTLRARTLLAVAAAGMVVMPFLQAALEILPFWSTPEGASIGLVLGWNYPFTLWWVFLVAGMGIGRLDLRRAGTAALLLGAGVAIAMIGYGIGGALPPDGAGRPEGYLATLTSALPHSGGLPEVVGSTGFAVAVLGLCLLVCRTPLTWVVLPLRATGSMPLTAYTAQILAWAIWASLALGTTRNLGAFRDLEPFWPLTIGVVLGCTIWALILGRGPLETLLHRLTARPRR